MTASMSLLSERASPTSVESKSIDLICLADSTSPSEEAGKPTSILSTPMLLSFWAICILSSTVSATPGVCSPSLKVVSKM